jgi:hypothetical protein
MRLPCGYCELRSTTDSLLGCRSSPVGLRHFYFLTRISTGPNFSRPNIYMLRVHGGRGRIRTSVARKERQIYSLLVLATHPPVLEKSSFTPSTSPANICQKTQRAADENTKRTRVKRHQPVDFVSEDSLRLIPPQANRWSWRRELNPRPSDYKSDALPAELRQRSQTDKE